MSVRPSPISGTTVVPPSKFALNWALLSPPECGSRTTSQEIDSAGMIVRSIG